MHCGGKQRMPKIISALRKLGVDLRTIIDIDVVNNPSVLKTFAESLGIDWEQELANDYNIFSSTLRGPKEKINRADAKTEIERILLSSEAEELSNQEIDDIKKSITKITRWKNLKQSGVSAIPNGNETLAFNRILEKFKSKEAFILEVGELENFVKEVSGHGPEWVNNVLENYPDMGNSVYDNIRNFVEQLSL